MATLALRSLPERSTGEDSRHVLVVCTGEDCLKAGGGELLKELKHQCRHARGDVRVGASQCLGHCQVAPAMVEDGRVLGAVSPRRLRCELRRIGVIDA